MTDNPKNLCLTCNLATWKRTAKGNLHPDGTGRCTWKQPHIPTPAAWRWGTWGVRDEQPKATGGYLHRATPVTDCLVYDWNGLRRPS